jgi:hypothetical protein
LPPASKIQARPGADNRAFCRYNAHLYQSQLQAMDY